MDFLDPKKQKAHAIRLAIGYVVIGVALLLATVILLYQAFGYSIDRHGRLIQNGLVFLSSTPGDAEIYANGVKQDNTSARLTMPAGQYVFEIKREGYRTWKRAITVEGGTVQRFDYPFLFPTSLVTTEVKVYPNDPGFSSQSLDRRWLLVQQGSAANSFDLYDLDRDEPEPTLLVIPGEILSAGTNTVGWEEIEWAKDNRHVVLRRSFDRAGQRSSEIILLDRERPTESHNLTVALGFTPSVLELRDQAYDQYYVFDQPNRALFTASLEKPTPQPLLSNVLAFESEGSNTLLYATNQDAPTDKTLIRLREGNQDYALRQVASDAAPYLLELSRYENAWYVAGGASGEDKVYVYKNPLDTLKKGASEVAVPLHILKISKANYLDFAPENRFVMAENGDQFALYDVKTEKGYAYQLQQPVNNASGHASWMDEFHLNILSGDQLMIFDYDGTNQQTLLEAGSKYLPAYDPKYRKLFTISATSVLSATNLRTERDQ